MAAFFHGRRIFSNLIPLFGRITSTEALCRTTVRQISNSHLVERSRAFATVASQVQQKNDQQPGRKERSWQPRRRDSSGMSSQNRDSRRLSVENALSLMDNDVRRFGCITHLQLQQVYKLMQKENQVNSHQCLLMLRCLGNILADQNPSQRSKLADELWQKFKEMGVSFDVMHYNALLRVHLENEHKFNPTSFLAEMEENNITPNRVTYQRLVASFCQDGDIQGASQILEHMKSKGIPINEHVFNSLVTGHMRCDNEESAYKVLDIMRESSIYPSADTYTALMCGYGEHGKFDSIEMIIKQAKEEGVTFYPNHFFALYTVLCDSGHKDFCEMVLQMVPMMRGYNQDARICILQLVAKNHVDEAYKVYLSMQMPVEQTENEENRFLGRFFLKALIQHEVELEKVMAFMKDMNDRKLNSDDLSSVAQWALLYEKPDYSIDIFRKMKEQGLPVRTHYFWPIIMAYKHQNNKEGIYNVVKVMDDLVDESSEYVHTLHFYLVPSLEELGESLETIVEKLMVVGVARGDAQFANFLNILKSGKTKEALEYGKKCNEIRCYSTVLRPYIDQTIRKTDQLSDMMSVLAFTSDKMVGQSAYSGADLNSDMLFTVVKSRKKSEMEDVVNIAISKNLKIPIRDVEPLQKLLLAQSVSQDIAQKISEMGVENTKPIMPRSTPTTRRTTSVGDLSTKTTAELESILKGYEDKGYTNTKNVFRWLLNKYCAEGNIERVEEIKKKIEQSDFVYTPDTIRQFIHLAALHKKDLKEALHYKDLLESKFSDFSSYISTILHTARLMAENGDYQGVKDILADYHSRHSAFMLERDYGQELILANNCNKLLESCSGNMAECYDIMKLLFELGYVKNNCYQLLEQYINGFIKNNDAEGALEGLQRCVNDFNRVPMFDSVFKMFIEREDPDGLQKAMDLSTQILGEMQVLHYLIYRFIESGRLPQAKKILETPGLRALMEPLKIFSSNFIRDHRLSELETLVSVTKNMFAVDKEELLFQLVRGYCSVKDMTKALDVYTQFEEENVTPRFRTLRYLGKALLSSNMEVPFEIPPDTNPFEDSTESSTSTPLHAEENEVMKNLRNKGDIPNIANLKKSLSQQGKELSPNFMKEVIDGVYKLRQKGTLPRLLYQFSDLGDVESIQKTKNINLVALRKGLYHASLLKAHLVRGEIDEILEKMSENIDDLEKYLSTSIIQQFAQKSPQLFPKLVDLVMRSAEAGSLIPVGHLWNHYMMGDELDKADSISKRYPLLYKSIRLVPVCTYAKNENRLDILNQMLENMGPNDTVNRAFVYSYVIGLQVENQDVSDALETVNMVKSEGIELDQLRPIALRRMEELLLAKGKQVPWPVGAFNKDRPNAADSSDSSSSSDSDSDSENK
ncbi:leucine-rich PPR motif-containing protein, mitochondrial-like [Tubulanus polymorphus]|uniref:leucine-rich PPR motif-containing protein, mitochondrial-like n=1 Tax=Tubulanus polymorphus TaxID=672921 RepID=UPI003DA4E842